MVTTGSACSDSLQFFRAWAGDPLRVAAVAPSSRSLASLMTRELGRAQGPVIELGPGTGVFTRAMIERGVDESDLTLVERGPEFASMLRQRFPKARVMEIDAARLGRHALFHGAEAVAVVSGLPLLSMPPRKIMAIVAGAFGYIRPTGCFYQFTYGPRCPVPRPILDRLGLKAVRTGGTYRNLPPAAVYRLSRRGPFDMTGRAAATDKASIGTDNPDMANLDG
jgi:phosphatidylethanolamine/phosphatidyl-N-methylethanolamine N-methyltransferase